MEKIILVGINMKKSTHHFQEDVEESIRLCEACHFEVVETIVQNLEVMDRQTCVGSGKLMEIAQRCEELEVETVVFHNELSPLQISHIAEVTNTLVLDRTGLILNIFSMRAKTREAQIQTEMARLQYNLPRLVYEGAPSDQQRGGSGVKNKGKGETSLELRRRVVEKKISSLKKELKSLITQTNIQKSQRLKSNLPLVALVGYTNAGKSSLMNALLRENKGQEDKQVFEKDMLFATLDTSIRHVMLDSGKEFLLFDTVGFISNLPTHLIEAFKSTLSAIKEADLLIEVLDASSGQIELHHQSTLEVLEKIEAIQVPRIEVYNKCDLVADGKLGNLRISVKTGQGLDELMEVIEKCLYPQNIEVQCIIPYDELGVIQELKKRGQVEFLEDEETGQRVRVCCGEEGIKKIEKFMV
ncbi:MAG: GTPase HflX [Anaerorhabdus sp.]